jgi:2-polyprenyl-3-methyl-5-hydroxy-6-metoxy-1,4-benzoquinol methylase
MDLKEINLKNILNIKDHWWYKARAFALIFEIKKNFKSSNSISCLEVGSGSAINLYHLAQEFSQKENHFIGIDHHYTESLITELKSFLPINCSLYQSTDLLDLSKYDVLILMDVLEHIDDPIEFLKKITNQFLKADGLIFISVPALQGLWSSHDENLGHFKRYHKEDIQTMADTLGLKIKKSYYLFSFLIPIIFFTRVLPYKIKILLNLNRENKTAQFQSTPRWINSCLICVTKIEFKIRSFLPYGSSLFTVLKK